VKGARRRAEKGRDAWGNLRPDRDSGTAEFASAAPESVALLARDLLDTMRKDWKGA
jgi:hypothetical protein